jgi:tRNA pseudouridine55 synthase
MKKLSQNNIKPKILNIYKPEGISSFDVIRNWKRRLRGHGKIGHFGTLDPFASGVLMLGITGAQKLNNFIHDCLPKSYLAIGKLGVETETGDLTVEPAQIDETDFLKFEISKFSEKFIEEKLRDQFLGEYWQAPHKYSAAKFEGKALHKWAREGVEIKKEKKQRFIHDIKVVKYDFPYLHIHFEVSSGTYIRTLFSECANYLGTLGCLEGLIREKVGMCTTENSIKKEEWDNEDHTYIDVDEVLDFPSFILAEKEANLYMNGVRLKINRIKEESAGRLQFPYRWVRDESNEILGLAEIVDDEFHSKINFIVTS